MLMRLAGNLPKILGLRPSKGTNGQLVETDGSKFTFTDPLPKKNCLYNGGFRVAQRGTSFTGATVPLNDDGNWLLDRWLLLSEDANDIVDVSQETTIVPTNAFASIALDVETGNRQFGICQILEERDSVYLAGNTVSLSFEARISAGGTSIGHLRAAVLGWSGTADTVTSDVVGTWLAAGNNHTLATSWNYENTPASLATLTTSFQTFKIENVSITAGRGNIAVFIWVDDDTLTATHILYIGNVKLEVSSTATPFVLSSIPEELALCQRYYAKTFDQATAPAQNIGLTGALHVMSSSTTANDLKLRWAYPQTMRTAPTLVTFNPSGANNSIRNIVGAVDLNADVDQTGDSSCVIESGSSVTDGDPHALHITADAEL